MVNYNYLNMIELRRKKKVISSQSTVSSELAKTFFIFKDNNLFFLVVSASVFKTTAMFINLSRKEKSFRKDQREMLGIAED